MTIKRVVNDTVLHFLNPRAVIRSIGKVIKIRNKSVRSYIANRRMENYKNRSSPCRLMPTGHGQHTQRTVKRRKLIFSILLQQFIKSQFQFFCILASINKKKILFCLFIKLI